MTDLANVVERMHFHEILAEWFAGPDPSNVAALACVLEMRVFRVLTAQEIKPGARKELHFVTAGMPGPGKQCAFIEVENEKGHSVCAGEWRKRPDGEAELVVRFTEGK